MLVNNVSSEATPAGGPNPQEATTTKAAEGEHVPISEPSMQLEPWMVEEAMRFFETNLLLDAFRQGGEHSGDIRAGVCVAHFRSLIECWQPQCADFWQHCAEFNRQWAPGPTRGPLEKDRTSDSPRARPLSAGRLMNYLGRLSLSIGPATPGAEFELCFADEKDIFVDDAIVSTAKRFGIRLSDIRTTCDSVFQACRSWTGLDWGMSGAADPCPWPVPEGLDGLLCCWRQLAANTGHNRVYLNPPWSKMDQWLYKAVRECRNGIPVLAVVPAWLTTACDDIRQFSNILDKWDAESPPRQLDIQSKLLWDAEFAHPTSGARMPPLNVMLIWLRCGR